MKATGNSLQLLFFFFRYCGMVMGAALILLGTFASLVPLKLVGFLLGVPLLGFSALVVYWTLRRNEAQVSASIVMDAWDIVADGKHNSNTDLVYWKGAFYLVHAAAPYHLGSPDCKLVVRRSEDGHSWEQLSALQVAPDDIRDPKFAIIEDRLFLYALKNISWNPEPYTTVFTTSQDGVHWEPFQEIEPQGWLFWKPKTSDGLTYYVPAYWWEHGRSVLFSSTDGIHWRQLSEIYTGDRNDETDIEFLPDGRLIATARLEFSDSILGHPQGSTLIATSKPPYHAWQVQTKSRVTRLDGPSLFQHRERVYAVGRYQPVVGGPFSQMGSVFTRKRTSLFKVCEEGLVRLSDLPSAGDTAYSGAVVLGDELFVSYYTSDVRKDYVWVAGMLSPSNIRMARVSLDAVNTL